MRELRPKLGYRREVADGFPNKPTLVAPRKPLPQMIVDPVIDEIGFPLEELRVQLRRRHRLMTGADLRMIEFTAKSGTLAALLKLICWMRRRKTDPVRTTT